MSHYDDALNSLISGDGKSRLSRFSISFTDDELKRLDDVIGALGTSRQKFINRIVMAAVADAEAKLKEVGITACKEL